MLVCLCVCLFVSVGRSVVIWFACWVGCSFVCLACWLFGCVSV